VAVGVVVLLEVVDVDDHGAPTGVAAVEIVGQRTQEPPIEASGQRVPQRLLVQPAFELLAARDVDQDTVVHHLTSQISPHIEDGFQFGDYYGMDVVMDELIAIFTDNRNEGGGGADSIDVYAAGKTVDGGSLIFADGFETNGTGAWSSTTP
jgi:hypothetical protein